MPTRSRPCAPRPTPRGFPLPEMLAVLTIVGVLAVVAMPRLDIALGLRDAAARDEVIAALHHARQTAVAHRRLVCVAIGTGGVNLTLAATRPATACTATLAPPDGGARWADRAAPSASPTSVLYVQPVGRITRDGAGLAGDTVWTISLPGQPPVVVQGETGHVQ